MTDKRIWQMFGAVLIAVIIVAGATGYFLGRGKTVSDVPGGSEEAETAPEPLDSMTREDVPPGTLAPDRGAMAPENVAVPEAVARVAPGSDSDKRRFSIEIEGGAFVPDTVIVNRGDIASITFTAVDGNYDLVQPDHGFSLDLPQGQGRLLEGHFATDGKYMFYCPSCGGPESGPKGYIVVVP